MPQAQPRQLSPTHPPTHPPTQALPLAPYWIGIPTTNPPSCELGKRCHRFILWGGGEGAGGAHKSSVFSERQSDFCAIENYIQGIA